MTDTRHLRDANMGDPDPNKFVVALLELLISSLFRLPIKYSADPAGAGVDADVFVQAVDESKLGSFTRLGPNQPGQ